MFFLFICQRVEKQNASVIIHNIEVMSIKLTYRKCALLPINHLILIIIYYTPIHNIKRETLHYSIDNSSLLCFIITKLPLIRRANIKFAIITTNTSFRIVTITCY